MSWLNQIPVTLATPDPLGQKDFRTRYPSSVVENGQGYFQIPAFNINSLVTVIPWYMVMQFNYIADRAFSLEKYTMQEAVDWFPVISYRRGEWKSRFRL